MFKQLFLSTAIATAFAVTPVLADDHEKMNKDDPEWEQKVNKTKHDADKKAYDKNKSDDERSNHPAHDMEGSDVERTNTQGETKSYDEMDREEGEVRPDKKAYDKNGDKDDNDKHPAHKMGDGDPVKEQGQ